MCFEQGGFVQNVDKLPELCFRLGKTWRLGCVSTFPENPLLEVSYRQQTLEVKNAGIYTIIELMDV